MKPEMEFYYTRDLRIYRIQPGKNRFEKHVYHIATGSTEINAMDMCEILAIQASTISDCEEYERELITKLDNQRKIIAKLRRKAKAK